MADYDFWRATFGSQTHLAADGTSDGRIDSADYVLWRNNSVAFTNSATTVPEPLTIVLAGVWFWPMLRGVRS